MVSLNRVGLVYDERCLLHRYKKGEHFENPDRILIPYKHLEQCELLSKLHKVQTREAYDHELKLCHSQCYTEEVREARENSNTFPFIQKFHGEGPRCTYFSAETYLSAKVAAGSAIELTNAVISKEVEHGFALIRPPGHHACNNMAAGYCFFNNIAVAAKHAIKQGMKRILIIDWDVHHGNGTQDIFYNTDQVLYISLHRFDAYPATEQGDCSHYGAGNGFGYNINIPWLGHAMGDGDYRVAFEKIIMPVARKFAPDLIMVSCGFDSAHGDPFGGYNLTIPFYGWMTSQLMALAQLVVFLEGGYLIENMTRGCEEVVQTLLTGKPSDDIKNNISEAGIRCIEEVIAVIKEKWLD